MDIKLINVPLYYGCDNPGTHLAPREFSRSGLPAQIEACGHRVADLTVLSVLPPPEDKFQYPTMKYRDEVCDCCRQLAKAVDTGRHLG